MKINIATTLLLLASFIFSGCKEKTAEDIIEENLTTYATAYFNWDFPSANGFATTDAKKWLTLLASQVTEKDISALKDKEEPAKVEIEDIELYNNDETAKTTIVVSNFLCMDSIGKTPRCCEEEKYEVSAVKKKEGWKFGKPQKVK